jgi:hypothetical protein
MDGNRFDELLRSMTVSPSRRGIARALGRFSLAGIVVPLLGLVGADGKKSKPKKKRCKGGLTTCKVKKGKK